MKLTLPAAVLVSSVGAIAADSTTRHELNSTDATSLRRLQESIPIIVQLCGVDLVGNPVVDVTNFKIANDPDWCGIYATNRWDAVTWTDFEGGTCWKKQITGFRGFGIGGGQDWVSTPNPRAVSFVQLGTHQRDQPFPVKRYDGYDMPGHDIGSVQWSNADDCPLECIRKTNCFAVSWTDYQGGTCWFKARANVPVRKAGALSVIIARPAHAFGACPRL